MYSVQCTYEYKYTNASSLIVSKHGVGYWGGMMYSVQCTYEHSMSTYIMYGELAIGEVCCIVCNVHSYIEWRHI